MKEGRRMIQSLKRTRRAGELITYLFCITGLILSLFPLVWTLTTALKPSQEMFSYPPTFIPTTITLENFVYAWNRAPFARFFFNSIFITTVVVGGQIFFSAMAAYAFARIPFPGKNVLFLLFLSSMMIPTIIVLIPQFIMMRMLGMLDSYWALILPGFFGNAFSVFFLRQFFMSIPDSIQEAAEIDGCSHSRIFFQIFLPLSKHSIITIALVRTVATWNDFLWPLIVTNRQEMRTIPTAIATIFFNYMNIDWAGLTAASSIALIPLIILFLSTRDYLMESITLTGFK